MKKIFFKYTILLLALTCACACAFCGCNRDGGSDPYSGIVISQEQPYSKETEEYAETVIFSVLKNVAGVEPNDKLTEKLKGIAKDVQEIMAKTPIHDTLYRAMLERLEADGADVIKEVQAKGAEGFVKTKSMYLELSSMLGASYVGGILYDLSLYYCQYQHDQNIANYEKYGYSYMKLDAEQYKWERQTLEEGIGKVNFTTLIKSGLAFADLFLGSGLQSEQVASFTDAEILTFIKGIELSSLSLTEEGWQLVFSRAAVSDGQAYSIGLLNLMKEHNLAEGAKALECGVKLLSNSINRWTEAEAELLRSRDVSGLLQRSFESFEDADWDLFKSMTNLNLKDESYDALAIETYGEGYLHYKENLTVYNLEELKKAVGQEHFNNVLKGYVAGISPAISYGMSHD